MKIRMKLKEVKNAAALFAISIDGQEFHAAINPLKLDREQWIRPGEDYHVIDASHDYNYGVTMDRACTALLDAQFSIRSTITEHMRATYDKLIARKERTAKQERIGLVLDTITWKYSFLRTAKDVTQAHITL